MKITTILGKSGPVPAALLSNGKLVDLAAASSVGLVGNAPLYEVNQILDLDGELNIQVRKLVEKLDTGNASLEDQLDSLGAFQNEADATYSVISRPSMIIALGMAYNEHVKEMGVKAPSEPHGFYKSPSSMSAHRQPLRLPPQDPNMVDYECEFACVIGRAFHNASPDEVMQHIAGYTMVNDVSSRSSVANWIETLKPGGDARQSIHHHDMIVFEKQYPGFCPMGPVIVSADAFGDPADVTVETRLNGEVMQSAHSSDLIFSIAKCLSYFSRWHQFQPGDVMTTGSPSGVGYAHKPPIFLKPGDVVEVSARDIGALSTPIVA